MGILQRGTVSYRSILTPAFTLVVIGDGGGGLLGSGCECLLAGDCVVSLLAGEAGCGFVSDIFRAISLS